MIKSGSLAKRRGVGRGVDANPCRVSLDEGFMRLAIEQAERARGQTGDNPWVGCAIVGTSGEVLGLGYTRGPGEHHAEISAAADAASRGHSIVGATLYSTLEPCSFHGRTPACAHAIVLRGLRRVVTAIRDPNPRVDGAGISILREGGVEVLEGVCEREVWRQLGAWIVLHHPQAIAREAASLSSLAPEERMLRLSEKYAVEPGMLLRALG
jgi:diaminohydroxyphosphoribosylaminopyrimidine deaminase / 5-amino-6-(5-phosphoribosylamino)uracil reductase